MKSSGSMIWLSNGQYGPVRFSGGVGWGLEVRICFVAGVTVGLADGFGMIGIEIIIWLFLLWRGAVRRFREVHILRERGRWELPAFRRYRRW